MRCRFCHNKDGTMPCSLVSSIGHVLVVDQRSAEHVHWTGRVASWCDIICGLRDSGRRVILIGYTHWSVN